MIDLRCIFAPGRLKGLDQIDPGAATEFTNFYCTPQPELLVFKAHEKFDAGGELIDDATASYLRRYLAAFAEWVQRFAGRQQGD